MSKELNINLYRTGLTVTANVYLLGVLKASAIPCPEIGVTGAYSGDFSATPNVAGVYRVEFFVGAETLSSGGGQIVWDGAAEVTLTSAERNSIADAILDRDMASGVDGGSTTVRTVRQALRFLRNKWAIVTGTLTVYKEDDATPSWTSAVSTTPNAQSVTGTDPAGP